MSKTFAIKRVSFSLVLPLAITLSAASYAAPDSKKTDAKTKTPRASAERLRVIMSTDFPPIGVVKGGNAPADRKSDADDMQSMVRFLLYANEFDIEGLIASAGTFANKAKKQNILDVIGRYEQVYGNLKKHDPLYPTPDYLRSVTFQGRSGTWGKKGTVNIGAGKDSEASDAVIAIVDKPDPRPIYIGIWGDCSVIAQAVWKVRSTRSPAELDTFLSKLRIHQIATQDGSIGWLRDNFPNAPQSGVKNVKLVFVNGNVNINEFVFSASPQATPKRTPKPAVPPTQASARVPAGYKPRIINTTDLGADPDDIQSMVRQLVCANEFDIEGLIVSTGCWKKSQRDTRMLDRILEAYGQMVGNLRVHAKGYPSLEYLKSISVMGLRLSPCDHQRAVTLTPCAFELR